MLLESLFLLILSRVGGQFPDVQHPAFHAMPESLWMNDPNGPMFYKGYYHLFYQHNPYGPEWGSMSWGHVISKDLAHWTWLPIIMYPDEPYDAGGVFSGSVSIIDGVPLLLYTCVDGSGNQAHCQASPVDADDPFLLEWEKFPNNPLIPFPPDGVNRGDFRDPTELWEFPEGVWNLLIGSRFFDTSTGAALRYTTVDFNNWTYRGTFWTGQPHQGMWECPDFYRINDDLYVFHLASIPWHRDFYTIGKYNATSITEQHFEPLSRTQLYDMDNWYASKTFFDPVRQKRLIWGWVAEDPYQMTGWQGVMTLPRIVNYDPEFDQLITPPIETISLLRKDHTSHNYNDLQGTMLIPDFESQQFEIIATFETDPNLLNSEFGINVRVSDDLEERTKISLTLEDLRGVHNNLDLPGQDFRSFLYEDGEDEDANIRACREACIEDRECFSWTYVRDGLPPIRCTLKNGVPLPLQNDQTVSGTVDRFARIQVDRSQSGGTSAQSIKNGFMRLKDETTFTLRVFVDHSYLEIYAQDGRAVMSTRVYPDPEALSVEVFSRYNPIKAHADLWKMESAWIEDPGKKWK